MTEIIDEISKTMRLINQLADRLRQECPLDALLGANNALEARWLDFEAAIAERKAADAEWLAMQDKKHD